MTHSLEMFYRGKTVAITGHTGFKGSWLATWLTHMGARVVGYALEPPSEPSHFECCRIDEHVAQHILGDVRDYEKLTTTFRTHRPDIVLHLAAQALVRPAYRDPRHTFEVNIMGTVNVLEAARQCESVQGLVVVTSDKCYRNVGWEWSYRESDQLGGHEAYSTSKACAELVSAAYQDPVFQHHSSPSTQLPVATARAGNAIGGGDWATDRIIPDIIRAVVGDQELVIRHPGATRPWQHALEALSGYLWLAKRLTEAPEQFATAWNFGPHEERMVTVEQILRKVIANWPAPKLKIKINGGRNDMEKLILGVDCSRAHHRLGWHAVWPVDTTLEATIDWYRAYYAGENMHAFTVKQIERYAQDAQQQNVAWASV